MSKLLLESGDALLLESGDALLLEDAVGVAPTITSNGGGPTAAISFAEGSDAPVATVTATGAPTPTFSITGGADAADFSIGSSTGVLTFNVTPDYESPHDADANNTYVVEVTATNDEGSDAQTITVTVTDADEGVVFAASFASGTDGFSAGTQTSEQNGPSGAAGVLSVSNSIEAVKSFTPITSGLVRLDFFYKVADSLTGSDGGVDCNIYLLPDGAAVSSANAAGAIKISRRSDEGVSHVATSTTTKLARGTDGGFTYQSISEQRQHWHKVSLVLDIAARTYDLYVQNVLWQRGVTTTNTMFTDVGQVAIASGGTGGQTTYFDDISLHSGYSVPTGTVLIEHDYTTAGSGDIKGFLPDTDDRNLFPQYPVVPTDTTTYGAFTASGSGIVGTANKKAVALYRCGPNGTFEATWTLATSGSKRAGLMFRSYNSVQTFEPGYWALTYDDSRSAGEQLRFGFGLECDDPDEQIILGQSAGTAGGVNYSAGGEITLKVVANGRYFDAYVNDQLQFANMVVFNDETGGRGLLCEDHAGPLSSGSAATTNYCTNFKYTGVGAEPFLHTHTVGPLTFTEESGSIKELYHEDYGSNGQRNIFWSRGIQFIHIARHDVGEDLASFHETVIDSDNVVVTRHWGNCLSEETKAGYGEAYLVFLRRGMWISETIEMWMADLFYTPDQDFQPDAFVGGYLTINGTGSATSRTHSFTNWTEVEGDIALPAGHQLLGSPASGDKLRFSMIQSDMGTDPDWVWGHNYMNRGEGTGISHTVTSAPPHSVGDVGGVTRSILIETGSSLALDSTMYAEFRDDVKTPATISTFATGSLKTDAAGDLDTDGFNERYGWYEIDCDGNGEAAFTFPVASGTRFMPVFRLSSWDSGSTEVTIAGTPGVEGTDYVIDDVGGGVAILQLLSNRTGNTTIAVEAAAAPSGARRRRLLLCGT